MVSYPTSQVMTKAELTRQVRMLSANVAYLTQKLERIDAHFTKFEERTNKRLHRIETKGQVE